MKHSLMTQRGRAKRREHCHAGLPAGWRVERDAITITGDSAHTPNQRKHIIMSWNIKVIGSPAEVKAYVLADIHTPKGVKDVIASICSEPDTRVNGIRVEGYGHSGGGYGSIGKLEVVRVHILPEPAPEPVLADLPKAEDCPQAGDPCVAPQPASVQQSDPP